MSGSDRTLDREFNCTVRLLDDSEYTCTVQVSINMFSSSRAGDPHHRHTCLNARAADAAHSREHLYESGHCTRAAMRNG